LVSEFPLGTGPKREHFPRRNRLISGLSLGTLVVEAAAGSGSLITARLAADQGREVFAIPGSIHSPLSRGCHALIRDGAKLVETAQDIVDELGPLAQIVWAAKQTDARRQEIPEDPQLRKFLDVVGFDPVTIDALVDRSGLTIERISSMLIHMELLGLVETCPDGKYMRRP
jgi:DNA processing protein